MFTKVQPTDKQFFDKRATQLQRVCASQAFKKLGHCSPATHRICREAGSLDSAPGLNKGKILVLTLSADKNDKLHRRGALSAKTHLVKE